MKYTITERSRKTCKRSLEVNYVASSEFVQYRRGRDFKGIVGMPGVGSRCIGRNAIRVEILPSA